MDFHSLTRRELQSLCKLNKIPANITNVAMADALKSLEIVQGIEEFLNVSQSETADLIESMEQLEVSSPKAPNTRCRTSTRQKVKKTEAENLPPTATRTTRRGSKLLVKGVEESKNDTLKTPAISSSRRKALATSSCRKLSSQLNETEEEGFVDQKTDCILNTPAAVVTNSRRKATTVKKDSAVQKTYGTRRSTRLTEKKSAESVVEKESESAVKMNSLLDEVNVISEDVIEAQENTVGSDTTKAEVEEIAMLIEENLNVEATGKCGEEKVHGEVDNVKPTLDETLNQSDVVDFEEKEKVEEKLDLLEARTDDVSDKKLESDSISSPSEDEILEEKLDLGVEKFIVSEVDDQNPCENEKLEEKAKIEEKLEVVENFSFEEKMDEVSNQKLESNVSSPSEDEDLEEKLDLGEEKFEFSGIHDHEPESEEVSDHEPESDGISSASEDEDLEDKLDLGEEKLDAIEANDENLDIVSVEQSEVVVDSNPEMETEVIFDQKVESDGISSPSVGDIYSSEVKDQILSDNVVDEDDTSEVTDEVFDQKPESDIISSECDDEELIKEKFDDSEVKNLESVAIPTVTEEVQDVNPEIVSEKEDADAEKNQFCVYPAQNPPDEASDCLKPTPFKNMTIVYDDKENVDSGRKLPIVFVDEGKKNNNENIEKEKLKSLNDISIRQLKKQLKALTLKNINPKEDAAVSKEVATRPALQVLNENRLVGDEAKN